MVLPASALTPLAVLKSPVVLLKSALTPLAVLELPVVLLFIAATPMAVLSSPVVLLTSACVPRLVLLLCAAATPARESERMSARIRTEKNEAALVEWVDIRDLLYLRPAP
jgi:hypothetical protein